MPGELPLEIEMKIKPLFNYYNRLTVNEKTKTNAISYSPEENFFE